MTAVCFHPSDKFIATAGTDQHVFITPSLGAETKPEPVSKLAVPAWVNALAWSPDGSTLAVADHACSVRFYTFSESMELARKQEVRWRLLPFVALHFTNPTTLLAAGFDKLPVRFAADPEGAW